MFRLDNMQEGLYPKGTKSNDGRHKMTLSNYPSGVTGREYEIAGADSEWTELKSVCCYNDECADYEKEVEVVLEIESYGDEWTGSWTCGTCKTDRTSVGDMEDYNNESEQYSDR